jgi:hypothetical protein
MPSSWRRHASSRHRPVPASDKGYDYRICRAALRRRGTAVRIARSWGGIAVEWLAAHFLYEPVNRVAYHLARTSVPGSWDGQVRSRRTATPSPLRSSSAAFAAGHRHDQRDCRAGSLGVGRHGSNPCRWPAAVPAMRFLAPMSRLCRRRSQQRRCLRRRQGHRPRGAGPGCEPARSAATALSRTELRHVPSGPPRRDPGAQLDAAAVLAPPWTPHDPGHHR